MRIAVAASLSGVAAHPRSAGARQPAFAWPLGIAAGVLFEVIPGTERHAGGQAGTVLRGVRITDARDVPDAPRSSWPADEIEWVSVAGLVGVEPREARAWLATVDGWILEERFASAKGWQPDADLLEAVREDALRIVLDERRRSRRRRKATDARDLEAVEST